MEQYHGTTILGVKKDGKTVIAGDGQVSLGNTVIKPNAKKVRRLGADGSVIGTGLRSAAVDADSDNGSVRLTFAEPPRNVEATTDNGSVEVVVPDDDTTYLVDIDSQHGSTDIGVRTDPDSDRLVRGRTQNGNVTVRYPTG